MSLRQMADGSWCNPPDIICAACLKPLSHDPPPENVLYWLAFCSAECLAKWRNGK